MKVISKKPLINITSEEEKAIEAVAELLNEIHASFNEDSDVDLFGMLNGDELCDVFFDNDAFNCEVAEDSEG